MAIGLALCAGCSSSNPASADGGKPGSGGSTGGTTVKKIGVIPQLATPTSVTSFVADAQGVVFVVLGAAGQELVACSPSGQVSTLYKPGTSALFGYPVLDGANVDLAVWDLDTNLDGIYAVSRAGGGARTPIFTRTTDRTTLLEAMVVDAANIYVVSNVLGGSAHPDGGVAAPTAQILAVAKSSGQAVPIYSAPAGQQIANLFLDGTSLYWTETDAGKDNGATAIRTATAGASAVDATTVGTLASPSDVNGLVATNGTVVAASLVTSVGPADAGSVELSDDAGTALVVGGVFAIPAGTTTPVTVTALGAAPMAVNPGIIYFNYGTGIAKVTVTAAGVSAPVQTPANMFASAMAADGQGAIYFLVLGQNSLFKL